MPEVWEYSKLLYLSLSLAGQFCCNFPLENNSGLKAISDCFILTLELPKCFLIFLSYTSTAHVEEKTKFPEMFIRICYMKLGETIMRT